MRNTESQSEREQPCQATLEEAHAWLLRREGSDAFSVDDHKAFRRWLDADPRHRDMYDQATTFRDAMAQLDSAELDADLTRVTWYEKYILFRDALYERSIKYRYRLAVPVVLLIVVVVGLQINQQIPSGAIPSRAAPPVLADIHTTQIGQVKTIALGDGSSVTLGAASRITVSFSETLRQVDLHSGAAYFDVTPDSARPFTVTVDTLRAIAVGTAFDVRKTSQGYRVAVAEGRVNVGVKTGLDKDALQIDTRALRAGQQVFADLSGSLAKPTDIAVSSVGAWQNHKLIYTGESLAEVISDANRYSNIPIEIDQMLGNYRVRGVFLGSDVDRLLSSLAHIHPLFIDRSQPHKIRIRKKP